MAKFVLIALFASTAVSLAKGQCSTVYESGVGDGDQNIIVNKHNSLRLSLAKGQVSGQPRACNMKRLAYDGQLAEAAQKIANTCVFQHVNVQDSRWTWVGQNLYMMMSTALAKGADWNSAIQSWFDEHNKYHYPDNPDSATGHYTQVAWADTEFVGCGYTNFLSTGTFKYRKLYVCNYGPGGNIVGSAPYKTFVNGQCGCKNLC